LATFGVVVSSLLTAKRFFRSVREFTRERERAPSIDHPTFDLRIKRRLKNQLESRPGMHPILKEHPAIEKRLRELPIGKFPVRLNPPSGRIHWRFCAENLEGRIEAGPSGHADPTGKRESIERRKKRLALPKRGKHRKGLLVREDKFGAEHPYRPLQFGVQGPRNRSPARRRIPIEPPCGQGNLKL
jgi:hypothetical protein